LSAVEAALREIGARPLSQFKAIRTKSGQKRLWAVKGSTVPYLYENKQPRDIAAMYDEGRKLERRSDIKAEAEEAAGEFIVEGNPWD
jgi:hypothetical protein